MSTSSSSSSSSSRDWWQHVGGRQRWRQNIISPPVDRFGGDLPMTTCNGLQPAAALIPAATDR
jgi:hypothetical protein